jgi:hypothetical protein
MTIVKQNRLRDNKLIQKYHQTRTCGSEQIAQQFLNADKTSATPCNIHSQKPSRRPFAELNQLWP